MTTPGTAPKRRLLWLAVAATALLAVGSGGLFYAAMKGAAPTDAAAAHKIVVGDKVCEPNDFTVSAGRVTFEIHNASNRVLEWEILDGVMVVEERENIAPGFRSRLTARLKPGTYQITCGLLSNPRGTLTVKPSAQSEAERKQPPLKSFIGLLSEYKVYLVIQSGGLVTAAEQLADDIGKGDLTAARQSYLAARLPYKRIEPAAGRFADLESAIDPVADYLDKREADPAFTGFHRIEYGLFVKNSVEGLEPVAANLVRDVTALKARLRSDQPAPDQLARAIERQSRLLAEGGLLKGDSRYAQSDLAETEATLDGIDKTAALLKPLLQEAAPDVSARIDGKLAATRAMLDGLKSEGGFPPYDRIDAQTRQKLAQSFGELAQSVAPLNAALGLE